MPDGHPFGVIRAFPAGETTPVVWMLGSSDYGAQVAAHFGIPYCFAHFITKGQGCAQALELYRKHYQPSVRHPKPVCTICVWALTADTEDEANFQFMSRARSKLARDRGVLQPIESPEDLAALTFSSAEQMQIEAMRNDAFIGTPEKVGSQLRTLAQELGLDELVILTWTHELAARKHSYSCLPGNSALARLAKATNVTAPKPQG